ncbi:MAG: DUF6879 family protein, partial [Nocardioides sp.]
PRTRDRGGDPRRAPALFPAALTGLLQGEDFARMFTTFERSARRLEARDRYDVEAERPFIARYRAGMQEDPDHLARFREHWLPTVRANRAQGRIYQRARVVPDPPSDYHRYALRGTRHTVGAGEDIGYLDRARANELGIPDHDYWLFDDERLVLMPFAADDRLLGVLLVTEPAVVAQHRAWLDTACAHATPYADYLAADPTREYPAATP